MLSGAWREPDPSCREDAQHVAVREQRGIAVNRTRPGNHPVDARTDLIRCLATRASVPEDEPARRHVLDLLGRQALVLAVVPLHEVGVDDGLDRKSTRLNSSH